MITKAVASIAALAEIRAIYFGTVCYGAPHVSERSMKKSAKSSKAIRANKRKASRKASMRRQRTRANG